LVPPPLPLLESGAKWPPHAKKTKRYPEKRVTFERYRSEDGDATRAA
jgi:hypothetical protein